MGNGADSDTQHATSQVASIERSPRCSPPSPVTPASHLPTNRTSSGDAQSWSDPLNYRNQQQYPDYDDFPDVPPQRRAPAQQDYARQQQQQLRPAPQPVRRVVARDSDMITTLRIATYLLTSLASVVFLGLVVFGYVQVLQLRDSFESTFGSGGSLPSFELPPTPPPLEAPLPPPG